MSETTIVSAASNSTDLAGVRPLVLAHVHYEGSNVIVPADWQDRMGRNIADGQVCIAVAREGPAVVGYATVTFDLATWTGERFAHLDCLYVEQAQRGTGIGRRLMQFAIDFAHDGHAQELQWQTPSWNAQARRFYERIGARSLSKQRFTLNLRSTATSGRRRNTPRAEGQGSLKFKSVCDDDRAPQGS